MVERCLLCDNTLEGKIKGNPTIYIYVKILPTTQQTAHIGYYLHNPLRFVVAGMNGADVIV